MPGSRPASATPIELAASGVVAVVGRFPAGPSDVAVVVSCEDDAVQFGIDEAAAAPPPPGDGGSDSTQALATLLAGGVPPCVVVRTGADGGPVTPEELIGDPEARTGLHALGATGIVDLVCLPDAADLPPAEAARVYAAAAAWCTDRGAFLLIDAPRTLDDVQGLIAWTERAELRSRDAAIHVPRPLIDTAEGTRSVPASAAVAAVIARTDRRHGVWTVPAGTDATLVGVDRPATAYQRGELEALNRAGIGVLRDLPGAGFVVWGARTVAGGGPAPDPEYRYVPVRRTVRLVERSLRRGLRWVEHAPNEPATWHEVTLQVTRFLDDLWRRGALRGHRPEQAFFVRCGHGLTMTDADLDHGTLHVQVGLAVSRPAEFLTLAVTTGTAAGPEAAPLRAPTATRPRQRVVVEGSERAARLRAERAVSDGLGSDVVRLDLDALASTYVGETERNLSLVIDLAADVDAVLLLDEADALFGRRSEVRDAHDRYADVEVAHTRHRLERYPGTVVLGIRDAATLGPDLEVRPRAGSPSGDEHQPSQPPPS